MKRILISIGVFLVVILLLTAFLFERDLTLEEAKAVLADEQSSFIEIDSMPVHYKREGKGFPIVLVHGTGAILQTWDEWTEVLIENGYEVIRMDVQSFGLTGPRADSDYALDSYVSFMEQFIEKLEIDSFHMAGNSLGGGIAWNYAARHPDKIGKMILLAPTGFETKDKEGALVFELAKIEWLGSVLRNLGSRYFVKKTLEDVYYDDSKISEKRCKQYLTAVKREGNRTAFVQRLNQEGSADTDQLSAIQIPTLLMWGDHDVLVPHHLASRFSDALPQDTLIVYPNVGHVPMEEIPLQSVQDALNFLNQ